MPQERIIRPCQKLCVIVNMGLAEKVIRKARSCGLQSATVIPCRGTVGGRVMKFIGLTDLHKELILMAADQKTIEQAVEEISLAFRFSEPGHGIAFTLDLCYTAGIPHAVCEFGNQGKGVEEAVYQAIAVIVDKGNAEWVIEAAEKAGSKGGTIINARGSGIHETSRIFGVEIEPEKEIVLILTKNNQTKVLVEAICEALKLEEKGRGILFVQPVCQAVGLYE